MCIRDTTVRERSLKSQILDEARNYTRDELCGVLTDNSIPLGKAYVSAGVAADGATYDSTNIWKPNSYK
jgi:hypothetical protein